MKYSASITAGVVAALLLQPCPAPLIATPIAALATGVVAGGGIAIGGAAAANAGGGGGAKRDIANALLARQSSPVDTTIGVPYDALNQCINDMFLSNAVDADLSFGYMAVYNCPSSCQSPIDDYNADPNIEALNTQFGTITWSDSTITMENMPDWLFQASVGDFYRNLQSEAGSGPVVSAPEAGPSSGPESHGPVSHGPPGRPFRRYERKFA